METRKVYSRKQKGQASSGNGEPNKRQKKGKAVEDPPINQQDEVNKDNPIEEDIEPTDEITDLYCRCSPKKLVSVLLRLNREQTAAVYEMGFGGLFDLQISEVPGKLARWCVTNFESLTCSIVMADGTRVRMTRDDVWLVSGLPRGDIDIDANPKKLYFDQWELRMGKSKITLKDVEAEVLKEVDGGIWFKRNFMILLELCLIEGRADGRIKPSIFTGISDLTIVARYDWCGYVIKALCRTHDLWTDSKAADSRFAGPVMFLVMFYVDRVVQCYRSTRRTFPIFRGWSWSLLKTRQKDEIDWRRFGSGAVEEGYIPTDEEKIRIRIMPEPGDESGDSHGYQADPLHYTERTLFKAQKMARSMLSFIDFVSGAPENVRSNEVFKAAVRNCVRVMSIPSSLISDDVSHAVQRRMLGYLPNRSWDMYLNVVSNAWEAMQQHDWGMYTSQVHASPPITHTSIASGAATANPNTTSIATDAHPAKHSLATCSKENQTGDTLPTPKVAGTSNPNPCHEYELPSFCLGLTQSPDVVVDVPTTTTSPIMPVQLNFDDVSMENPTNKQPQSLLAKDPSSTGQPPSTSDQTTKSTEDRSGCVQLPVMDQADIDVCIAMINEDTGGVMPLLTVVMPDSGDAHVDPEPLRHVKSQKKGKGVDEGASHHMESRTRDQQRAAAALLSPFNERPLSPTLKLSTDEKTFYYWVLTGPEPPVKNDYGGALVLCNEFSMVWSDVQTLRPGCYVSANTLNAWGSMLNILEHYRSPQSPYRFYFSVFTTAHAVVLPPKGWHNGQIVDKFMEELDDEIRKAKCKDFKKVDIVFFPVLSDKHYYIIVFDLRADRILIIDNSSEADDDDLTTKYKHVPKELVKLFNLYLVKNGHGRSKSLNRIQVERLKMAWHDEDNKVDCGIYCMRHMESFTGQRACEWNVGFKAGNAKQLRFLRAKYATKLLSSAYNELNEDNVHFANNHWTSQNEHDLPNIEKFVMEFPYVPEDSP